MKRSIILSLSTIAGFVLLFSSCEKVALTQKEELDPGSAARVKFGYFTALSASTNRNVHIKVNDERVTNLLTYAISFPGGGFNQGGQTFADYIAVNSSITKVPVNLRIAIPNFNKNTDSVVLFNGSVTLTEKIKQTVMFTDTMPNIQATVLNDETTDPSIAVAKFKFFNGIPNAGNIDFYVTSSAGTFLAASNVPYKGVSGYFETPVTGLGNITFSMYRAGTSPTSNANLVGGGTSTNHPYSTSGLGNGRVYTVLARGYTGVSLSDARRPQPTLIPTR
jgi:hypothetical protein